MALVGHSECVFLILVLSVSEHKAKRLNFQHAPGKGIRPPTRKRGGGKVGSGTYDHRPCGCEVCNKEVRAVEGHA